MISSTSAKTYCSYCKSSDIACLVQCHEENCGKWFCNHKKTGLNGSHIFFHLKFSHHRKIGIPSGQTVQAPLVCCAQCQHADLYGLSAFKHEGSTVVFCNKMCMNEKLKAGYVRRGPVIQENRIANYLVKATFPLDPEAVRVGRQEMKNIEKNLRKNGDKGAVSTAENSEDSESSEDAQKVKKFYLPKASDQYSSEKDYNSTFKALIYAEARQEREAMESRTHHNVTLTWKMEKSTVCAKIHLSNMYHFGGTLKVGGLLSVEGPKKEKRFAKVKCVQSDKNILVSFDMKELPKNSEDKYTVKPIFNGVNYRRMEAGLKKMSTGYGLSKKLSTCLLGTSNQTGSEVKKEPVYSVDNCGMLQKFNLNESQQEAALKALNAPSLFLIQGPPGTGKTHTLGAVIIQMNQNLGKYNKLLVCGPSNKAVDVVTKKLIENGVEGVCRIYAVSKEKSQIFSKDLESVALHKRIQLNNERLRELLIRSESGDKLPLKERQELEQLRKSTSEEIIKNSRVVCCTCSTAGDGRLEGFIFKNVFIDEAAQATEPECLLPWLFGAEKVILAGDHMQIGPIIASTEANQAGLGRSLFERLVSNPENYYMLNHQYRMHPTISQFPSQHFYKNQLVPHKSVEERKIKLKAPFPKGVSNFFYHIGGKEEIPESGNSQMNREEGQAVKKIVNTLYQAGAKPSQIGVITPYNGQKVYITELIESNSALRGRIDISSVDGFQGGEKDFIIISCVRSNEELGIGFLKDEKRLNVALTRARHGLIVCGNADVLKQDQNWKALLEHYDQKGHILNGSLKSLTPYQVKFD